MYRNNEDSFVDILILGVQLADVLTRCSSYPQGKSEVRCKNDGNFYRCGSPVQRSKHYNVVGAGAARADPAP